MCSNLPHYLFMRLGVQFLRKDVSLRRLRLDYRQQSWAFEKVRTILLLSLKIETMTIKKGHNIKSFIIQMHRPLSQI